MLIVVLKYMPMLIALLYALNTLLCWFGIDIAILGIFGSMSIIVWLFMLLVSIVFKFCAYHRMFLYYIGIINILDILDYYINIPLSDFNMLMLYSIITVIILFIILYLYVRNHKKAIVKNSR